MTAFDTVEGNVTVGIEDLIQSMERVQAVHVSAVFVDHAVELTRLTRELRAPLSLSRIRMFSWLEDLDRPGHGEGTRLRDAPEQAGGLLKCKSLLVVVSDFHDPAIDNDGIIIKSIEIDDKIVPVTEQVYTVSYQPIAGDARATEFAFPSPGGEVVVERARYADADIVKAEAVETIDVLVSWRDGPLPAILGVLFFLLVGTGLLMFARRRTIDQVEPLPYRLDPGAGPFATIILLRRMAEDPELQFGTEDRAELQQTLAALERRFFGRNQASDEVGDLASLGSSWIDRAQRVRAS